jgi:hypothetical protein
LDEKLDANKKQYTAKDVLKETLECAEKIGHLEPEEKTEQQKLDEKTFMEALLTICNKVYM